MSSGSWKGSRLSAVGFAAALIAGLAGAGAPAHAQQSDPEQRLTRGPMITGAARAGDPNATDVELNPGALGLLRSGSLELVAAWAPNGAIIPRRGAGLYWASPILFGSSLGFGLSGVQGDSALGFGGYTTLRLAYAFRLGRHAGLGASWGHIWGGAFGGTDTFDLGFSARAGRYFALGLTVEDVTEPRPAGLAVALSRLWGAEVAVRPLGTQRLELGLGVSYADVDEWQRVVPRARLTAMVVDGLRVYGTAQMFPPLGETALSGNNDLRIAFGMAVDLDHFGAMVGAHLYDPVTGDGGIGGGARIHVEGQRRPAAVSPGYIARVKLDAVDDDRDFVTFVRRVRALAVDPAVGGVLFKIEGMKLGMARIEEVRDLMALLRARGKPTFAYAPSPSTRQYYLASAADAVIIHPAGQVALLGLSQNITFYKGAMDRIGVHVDLVRIGEFKGAMEPFVMKEQSPEVRANKNRILDDVFGRLVAAIAADRSRTGHRMDAAEVRRLVDRALFTPGEAQLAGLIDAVADESELETLLGRVYKRPKVTIKDPDTSPLAPWSWPSKRIAVVLVDGTIVDGPSQELPFDLGSVAGSDTLVAALDQCKADGSIRAVILRVNSPGGSAFASDVVARAVIRLRDAGKPVIVSMGDQAASGGYYIAAPADVIFAQPSTMSGSIGIFGSKVDVRQLIDTLGVNVETYRRGAHADYHSPYRPWTEAEVKIAGDKIRHLYGLFLDTVASGRRTRGLTVARVDAVGRGQVWTGALAQSINLVDQIGGLSAAVDEAVRLTGVPLGRDQLPDIEVLPRSTASAVKRLIGLAAEAGEAPPPAMTPAQLLTPAGRAALQLVAPLLLGGGIDYQARMPYDIDIR